MGRLFVYITLSFLFGLFASIVIAPVISIWATVPVVAIVGWLIPTVGDKLFPRKVEKDVDTAEEEK